MVPFQCPKLGQPQFPIFCYFLITYKTHVVSLTSKWNPWCMCRCSHLITLKPLYFAHLQVLAFLVGHGGSPSVVGRKIASLGNLKSYYETWTQDDLLCLIAIANRIRAFNSEFDTTVKIIAAEVRLKIYTYLPCSYTCKRSTPEWHFNIISWPMRRSYAHLRECERTGRFTGKTTHAALFYVWGAGAPVWIL